MAKPIVNKVNTNKLRETICNVHQAQRTDVTNNIFWSLTNKKGPETWQLNVKKQETATWPHSLTTRSHLRWAQQMSCRHAACVPGALLEVGSPDMHVWRAAGPAGPALPCTARGSAGIGGRSAAAVLGLCRGSGPSLPAPVLPSAWASACWGHAAPPPTSQSTERLRGHSR